MAEPWERQSGETQRAWQAFITYRDMPYDTRKRDKFGMLKHSIGTRTLQKTAEKLGHTNSQTVQAWSNKTQWYDRALAYDEYLDGIRRAAYADEVEELSKAQARDIQALRTALMLPAQALLKKVIDDPQALDKLSKTASIEELINMVRMAASAMPTLIKTERALHEIADDPLHADMMARRPETKQEGVDDDPRDERQRIADIIEVLEGAGQFAIAEGVREAAGDIAD